MKQIICARIFSELQVVLIGDDSGVLHILQRDGTWYLARQSKIAENIITSIDLSSDSKYLLFTVGDSRVYIYDYVQMTVKNSLKYDSGTILSAKFVYDTHQFVFACDDKIILGDIDSGTTRVLAKTLNVNQCNIDVDKSGENVVVGKYWGEIELFKVEGQQQNIFNSKNPSPKVLFDHTSTSIGVCDGEVNLINLSNGRIENRLACDSYVKDFTFGSETQAVYGLTENGMYVWKIPTDPNPKKIRLQSRSNELLDISANFLLLVEYSTLNIYNLNTMIHLYTYNV